MLDGLADRNFGASGFRVGKFLGGRLAVRCQALGAERWRNRDRLSRRDLAALRARRRCRPSVPRALRRVKAVKRDLPRIGCGKPTLDSLQRERQPVSHGSAVLSHPHETQKSHILIEGAKTKNRPQTSRYREIENCHSAIHFVTPQDRHMGKGRAILADRKKVYEAAQNGIHNAGQAKPETGNASRSSR